MPTSREEALSHQPRTGRPTSDVFKSHAPSPAAQNPLSGASATPTTAYENFVPASTLPAPATSSLYDELQRNHERQQAEREARRQPQPDGDDELFLRKLVREGWEHDARERGREVEEREMFRHARRQKGALAAGVGVAKAVGPRVAGSGGVVGGGDTSVGTRLAPFGAVKVAVKRRRVDHQPRESVERSRCVAEEEGRDGGVAAGAVGDGNAAVGVALRRDAANVKGGVETFENVEGDREGENGDVGSRSEGSAAFSLSVAFGAYGSSSEDEGG